MNEQPQRPLASLTRRDLPQNPGVYALYRAGLPQYVGKAKSLSGRFWSNHMGRGASMTNSALRRNTAELLGIARAADIKARRYRTTAEDAERITEWLRSCDVAWVECASEADALDLEKAMKREWLPPLTKR
jgi:excinuclease UvrABC nuclease subunit